MNMIKWSGPTRLIHIGEYLALNRMKHCSEAYFATKEDDLKGEFGASVAIALFVIPALTKAAFDWSYGSAFVCGLALLFCALIKARQAFFRKWLAPQKLETIDKCGL